VLGFAPFVDLPPLIVIGNKKQVAGSKDKARLF